MKTLLGFSKPFLIAMILAGTTTRKWESECSQKAERVERSYLHHMSRIYRLIGIQVLGWVTSSPHINKHTRQPECIMHQLKDRYTYDDNPENLEMPWQAINTKNSVWEKKREVRKSEKLFPFIPIYCSISRTRDPTVFVLCSAWWISRCALYLGSWKWDHWIPRMMRFPMMCISCDKTPFTWLWLTVYLLISLHFMLFCLLFDKKKFF